MDMDEKTFQELVTAYGGDARRWPDDRRAAMQAFQDAHPQARAIVSCAAALDDWLEARLPDASADLHARISADMSKALAATDQCQFAPPRRWCRGKPLMRASDKPPLRWARWQPV